MHEEKQQLRREIARQKKLYSSEQLQNWSDQLMSLLEQTELFRQAHAIDFAIEVEGIDVGHARDVVDDSLYAGEGVVALHLILAGHFVEQQL